MIVRLDRKDPSNGGGRSGELGGEGGRASCLGRCHLFLCGGPCRYTIIGDEKQQQH